MKRILVSLLIIFFSFAACADSTKAKGVFSSDEYEAVVEKAISYLRAQDSEKFKALLSPALISRTEKSFGSPAVNDIISNSFMAFFKDVKEIEPGTNETTTSDINGNKGIVYFRTAVTQDSQQKPFAVYILEEGDKLVVGNVVVNKTMREIQQAASPK